MAIWVCYRCGKEVITKEELPKRCPYCGFRILFKKRPPIVKRLKAR